jgi:hypothetical protein
VPEFPGKGHASLPEDTADKAREWAYKEKFMEGIAAFSKDPVAALEAMGGEPTLVLGLDH